MKKSWLWIVGIILIVLIIVGVSYNNQPKENIKIAYLGPLSGEVASIGLGQQKAVQMAVDEINAKGGIKGQKIEVVYEDSKCSGKDATDAMNKLVTIDEVKYVVGGQCSSETLSAAPIAEENKVIMISPLSSNPGITNSGDYIFRVYPSDSYQGKYAANYIKETLKVNSVAVLSCLDDWCSGVKNVFSEEYTRLGGVVISDQNFEKGAVDLNTQLIKLKQENPSAIFMTSYTDSAIAAFKQAKQLGINATFVGGDAWDDNTIWEKTTGFNEGNRYVVPKSIKSDSFDSAFAIKYGSNESIVLAAYNNYDAVYILKQAIEKVGNNPEKVKNYLYSMPVYSGASGSIQFDKNGDLVGAEYVVKEIVNGSRVVL